MSAPEYADDAICPLLQHESGRFRLQISAAGKTAAARAAAELVPEALVPLADTVLQEPETGSQLPWDFSVVFCSNAFMQDLNRRFRNIDAPTDVLSFALGGEVQEEDGRIFFSAGEIVISLDQLAYNAAEFGVTENEELKRLVIHGMLHLSGKDHADNSPGQEMLLLQERILKRLDQLIVRKT